MIDFRILKNQEFAPLSGRLYIEEWVENCCDGGFRGVARKFLMVGQNLELIYTHKKHNHVYVKKFERFVHTSYS